MCSFFLEQVTSYNIGHRVNVTRRIGVEIRPFIYYVCAELALHFDLIPSVFGPFTLEETE